MSVGERLRRWRDWFPTPRPEGGIALGRWLLLEGNRHGVTAALLTFVFAAMMLFGALWTTQIQRLFAEMGAVQTILATLLSGIILLVSIVVSINSIVLSHDITSLETQESRIQGVMEFRRDLARLSDTAESPSKPATFLGLMADVLRQRAREVEEGTEGAGEEITRDVREYVDSIERIVDRIADSDEGADGAEFGVLWLGLEVDYGPYLDRSRVLRNSYESELPETFEERMEALVRAFRLFATGKEYFKTLYYNREISQLSRTLLLISLPAILVNAASILVLSAGMIQDVTLFGLPPLLTFVSIAFTVSLAPYLVLTSFMLRLATVARRTAAADLFSLES